MESSEEKLHQMLMKVRMNEAKEAAKKHVLDVSKRKNEPGIQGSSSAHFSSESYSQGVGSSKLSN